MGVRTKQLLILPRPIGEGIAEEVALRWAVGEAKFIQWRKRKKEPEKGESGGIKWENTKQSKEAAAGRAASAFSELTQA